jgi:hypothetical protein
VAGSEERLLGPVASYLSSCPPEILFAIRNLIRSVDSFVPKSWTMASTLRGERSESERLPELRRYRICCETCGLER